MSTRREFLKHSGVAGLGAATLGATLNSANAQVPGSLSSGDSAAMLVADPQHVAPATFDRLPLEWHQARVKLLQEKLAERARFLAGSSPRLAIQATVCPL